MWNIYSANVCVIRIWEAEKGGDQEFEDKVGYIVKSCLNT